jgi:hypothetical protein
VLLIPLFEKQSLNMSGAELTGAKGKERKAKGKEKSKERKANDPAAKGIFNNTFKKTRKMKVSALYLALLIEGQSWEYRETTKANTQCL